MNQRIGLLSDLPFKLLTPLSIIIMASARAGQIKFSSQFGRYAPRVDCVLFIKGFTIRE